MPNPTPYTDYSAAAAVDNRFYQAGLAQAYGGITEQYDPAWQLPCECWSPQPGPQVHAIQAAGLVKIILFGGTRGGGKTEMLLGDQILNACKWGPWWRGLIIRRKYKDFAGIRKRLDQLIRMGLPAERFGGETQLGLVKFQNGAVILLHAIPRLELADDHQGQDYTRISIEEAPLLPFVGQLIDRLKGCLRSVQGVPTGMVLTGNPGGPGASAVRLLFMETERGERIPPGQVIRERGADRVFIKSSLKDNRILMDNDPEYANQLMSIKDPLLRRAWLDGDWDAFIGQAFRFVNEKPPKGHVIDPIWPVPNYVPIYMSFDWGYGKPFSIGWWWVDTDGRLIRFAEWYGWDGETPDVGLRLTDEQIAEGIIGRERAMGIADRHDKIIRLAGPDCWNRKPNYMGGGQGPATEKVFRQVGQRENYALTLRPGDPSRELKIRQFRSRLAPQGESGLPMLLVYSTCYHFIRTIPALAMDELKPEDVDCFVAGTRISTPDGPVPVEQVRPGQWVDTPLGPRPVIKAYRSGTAPVTRAILSDGRTLCGTHTHKVGVNGCGLLPLIRLSSGQTLTTEEDCTWLRRYITVGSSSRNGPTDDTPSATLHTPQSSARRCSTALYGRTRVGRSLQGSASTTRTATPQTTYLKTLNAFLRESMLDTTSKHALLPVGISALRWRAGGRARQDGMLFARMLRSAVTALPTGNLRALTVASLLWRSILGGDTAPSSAGTAPIGSAPFAPSAGGSSSPRSTEPSRSGPVVVSVDGSCGEEAVYNITVGQAHLFYANGILSSNTDQEDHIYDEACHPCMANPIALSDGEIMERIRKEELAAAMAKLDTASRAAAQEHDTLIDRIRQREKDLGDVDPGEERVW